MTLYLTDDVVIAKQYVPVILYKEIVIIKKQCFTHVLVYGLKPISTTKYQPIVYVVSPCDQSAYRL